MNFDYSPKVQALQKRLNAFMDEHIYPNEARYAKELATGDRWAPVSVIEPALWPP